MLVAFWLLSLPLLVLFYAILVEGALPSAQGRAVTLTMLILIPAFLLHETWRWWSGRLDERDTDRRRVPPDRRHDDQPGPPSA